MHNLTLAYKITTGAFPLKPGLHSVHARMHVQINVWQQEALVHFNYNVQVIKTNRNTSFFFSLSKGQVLTLSWVFELTNSNNNNNKI